MYVFGLNQNNDIGHFRDKYIKDPPQVFACTVKKERFDKKRVTMNNSYQSSMYHHFWIQNEKNSISFEFIALLS